MFLQHPQRLLEQVVEIERVGGFLAALIARLDVFDLLEEGQEIRKLFREQFLDRSLGVDDEAEDVREHVAFRETDFLGIDPGARDDGVEQIFLVFAVHDREPARITEGAPVPPQHAVADGMKRPAPEPAGVDREQIGDAVEHLAGGLVREGEEEDVARVDALLEQVGDAIGEGARLARAGPGDDEQRSRRRGHGRVLLFVQFARVIDADRRRGGGALERVLAGHWGTTLERRSRLFNEKFRSVEAAACSRILFGVSAAGIVGDLGIIRFIAAVPASRMRARTPPQYPG